MTRLLHIEASPMKTLSHSIDVAKQFLDAYRAAHTNHEIDTIDLWSQNIDLPEFNADMIGAKFAVLRTQTATPEQRAQWQRAVALSQRFNAADHYLFSVPMWNFGVPYRLKHFIDVVTLPGQNWNWSPATGYQALLSGKKAALIYASAGAYAAHTEGASESPDDFQKPYLRRWLRFLGIEDVTEISAAPTLTAPDLLAATKADAKARAAALGAAF